MGEAKQDIKLMSKTRNLGIIYDFRVFGVIPVERVKPLESGGERL